MALRRSASLQISRACATRGASSPSSCERPKNENFRGLNPRTAMARFSSTLSVGNRLVIWNVRAMPRSAPNATTTLEILSTGSGTIDEALVRSGAKSRRSALLHSLEVAGVGRLLHVGLRIVFPELRDVRIARDRNVPELSVRTLHHLADVNVVDRIAVSIELDRLAERGIAELGRQHRIDQRVAVLDLAGDLLDRFRQPHHPGIHRETVERGA